MSTDDADTMTVSQRVGDIIKAYRIASGNTIPEAVELAKSRVSRSKWYDVESGENPLPKHETLVVMMRAVGGPVDVILRAVGNDDAADAAIELQRRTAGEQ